MFRSFRGPFQDYLIMYSRDLPFSRPRTPQVGTTGIDPDYSMSEMDYLVRDHNLLGAKSSALGKAATFSEQTFAATMSKWLDVANAGRADANRSREAQVANI